MPNNSGSSLFQLKSIIDKFFKLFSNFIDGYTVRGDKVTKERGGVKSSIVLKGQNGAPDLRIDLIATNISTAFKKTTELIDNINFNALRVGMATEDEVDEDDYADQLADSLGDMDAASKISKDSKNVYGAGYTSSKDVIAALETLVGPGCIEKVDENGQIKYTGDITLKTAMKKGKNGQGGCLGIDLNTVAKKGNLSSEGFKFWKNQAFNYMKYTLVMEAGNYDAGKVSNIKLIDCISYIDQYINLITNKAAENAEVKDKTHNQKVKAQKNKNTTAWILVTPILVTVQQELRNMYQNKLNSEPSLDALIPKNADKVDQTNPSPENEEFDEAALKQSENANAKAGQDNNSNNNGGGPTASQHINVTLKKIQASNDIDILRLESDYAPGATLSDIDEIINQEEFLNTLTEEPQAFAIEVDEEGFDIEPCEACPECSPCESLCEVFKAAIRAYRNLYIIHWMSAGNDMMKLHLLAEDMYSELIQEIDTLGELLVEKQGTVPQLDFPCDYVPVQKYEFQGSLETIKSLIQMYIDCIDYAYPNQTSDVQSTLDEWLRYWNKHLNYFVKGQEE